MCFNCERVGWVYFVLRVKMVDTHGCIWVCIDMGFHGSYPFICSPAIFKMGLRNEFVLVGLMSFNCERVGWVYFVLWVKMVDTHGCRWVCIDMSFHGSYPFICRTTIF
jgi:hypothetical protein